MMNKVPNGWLKQSFGCIASFKNGLNFTKSDTGEVIKIVGVGDFKNHSVLSNIETLDSVQVAGSVTEAELLQSGDLLFVRSNGNKDLIGRCLYFPNVKERLAYSGFTIRGRVDNSQILSEYASYLMRSSLVKKQFSQNGGGTNISNLSQQILNDIVFPLPPLPEQIKIAEILSTWDNAINTVQKLLSNSQQQKKALMQQLLTGKKRFVGFEGEWEVYLLEDLESMGWVELGRGNVISKKDIEKKQGLYPIYSSSVKNLGLMGFYDEFMFDEELISWSIDGGGNFFYRPKHKFSVTNVSGYMRLDGTKLSYRFMANQLELLHSKLEFDYQSKAHPSVIRKLYKIYLPELQEQQKIAAVLTIADQEIDNLRAQLNHLKQEKKALMQQLLTGKRRVKIEEAA